MYENVSAQVKFSFLRPTDGKLKYTSKGLLTPVYKSCSWLERKRTLIVNYKV